MAGSGTAPLRGEDVLLCAEHLVVEFGSGSHRVQAVSDVSFDVAAGETLGLVGESGCGKSTTGRAVALVHAPNAGSVRFDGVELTKLHREELRRARTKVQMVFQDPISSLNPRRRVLDAVVEPLAVWDIGTKEDRRAKARATLDSVGIDPDDAVTRRPIEMSGGQCQRVSIARALMLDPMVLICDEPVSALDVSVQAQILNLLDDLKRDRGLTMVFIAHDLAVVKNVSDRVAVMYLGKLCEVAPPDTLYQRPEHPYTEALLASIPEPDPATAGNGSAPLAGDLPSPIDPPSGCRFRTRCAFAQQRCADEEPHMQAIGPDHYVACHFPLSTTGGAFAASRAYLSHGRFASDDLPESSGPGVGDKPEPSSEPTDSTWSAPPAPGAPTPWAPAGAASSSPPGQPPNPPSAPPGSPPASERPPLWVTPKRRPPR
jgi:peptide/nickel transport system ATP-binding protein